MARVVRSAFKNLSRVLSEDCSRFQLAKLHGGLTVREQKSLISVDYKQWKHVYRNVSISLEETFSQALREILKVTFS